MVTTKTVACLEIDLVRIFSEVLVAFLYSDICQYQNMEKPLKHQRGLGLVWKVTKPGINLDLISQHINDE